MNLLGLILKKWKWEQYKCVNNSFIATYIKTPEMICQKNRKSHMGEVDTKNKHSLYEIVTTGDHIPLNVKNTSQLKNLPQKIPSTDYQTNMVFLIFVFCLEAKLTLSHRTNDKHKVND